MALAERAEEEATIKAYLIVRRKAPARFLATCFTITSMLFWPWATGCKARAAPSFVSGLSNACVNTSSRGSCWTMSGSRAALRNVHGHIAEAWRRDGACLRPGRCRSEPGSHRPCSIGRKASVPWKGLSDGGQ